MTVPYGERKVAWLRSSNLTARESTVAGLLARASGRCRTLVVFVFRGPPTTTPQPAQHEPYAGRKVRMKRTENLVLVCQSL